MAGLPITLTCADYARLAPLMIGDVKPEGLDLTLIHGTGGSWPARAEMLQRALQDPAVQGGEASMAAHLRRIDKGDRSFVGLPVFPLRNFTARDLYVRKDGPVQTAADLIGKRIGMYDWLASGSIWYRHFLNFVDVSWKQVEWWIGDVEGGWRARHPGDLPAGVHPVPEGRYLSEMLIKGDLDAVYSPPRPRDYHPQNGPIVRLFPHFRPIEQDYFRRTGVFPPQHLIVLRREVWERDKWIARSLTEAFIRADAMFWQAQRNFPYVSPWLEAELEDTEALIGADFHADGFEKNRAQVDAFCRQARELGITSRLVTAEEYFADFLASPPDR
jgi:4,5-dihydroxyphthalate decarboxylase